MGIRLVASVFSPIVLGIVLTASTARAGGPLAGNGQRISTSAYTLDLYSGLVWAGARTTGLAGSMVAIAEDVDSNLMNPATPAVRPYFSVDDFDYWLGLGLTAPGSLSKVDFFNTYGKTPSKGGTPSSALFLVPSANVQFGHLGVGVTIEGQSYTVNEAADPAAAPPPSGSESNLSVVTTTTHIQAAYAFMQNDLVIGAGARILSYEVSSQRLATTGSLFSAVGTGLEMGAVWKPSMKQFRIGGSFRTGISTVASYTEALLPNAEGDLVLEGANGPFYLPRGTALPWDLALGVAYQVGPRIMNPRWLSIEERIERQRLEHRLRELQREERVAAARARGKPAEILEVEKAVAAEKEADDKALRRAREDASWDVKDKQAQSARAGVLVSLSLIVSGGASEAVGIESVLSQTVNRSGTGPVVSPRIGMESEVWPQTLKLRAGTYMEPTRVETSLPRMHYTFGADVPVGRWDVLGLWPSDYLWRLSATVDGAERFYSFSFSIGGWYPRHYGRARRP